ncbi:hypothetical protein [Williamsia sp. 1135]|uniref:hypothetical protein n=1 Tax=Williamsia sp. 1135 TaxID=1889262 RepID=UPI000A10ACD5|nr:hypothetical protein [Williamsia sp. 1135]ORM34381.1 hypothetical protein BFL43_11695 [Williamsia sp. 1135]
MNRTILRTTTAVAAVSAAALFFPAVASAAPVSQSECAEISTGNQANGWGNTFGDESGQAGVHVAGGEDGNGALKFTTFDTPSTTKVDNRAASYHEAGGLLLKDVTGPLAFQHEGAVPGNWQIRVTGANTTGPGDVSGENGFATLVHSGDGADAAGSDQWWATRDLGTIARGTPSTLAALKAAAGDQTVVTHYGISIEGPVGTTATIDKVQFNGCTTDFRQVGSSEEEGASTGSLGGFGLANLIPGLPS